MQGLPWKYFKTVIYKLFVLGKRGTLKDPISSIALIVKERMSNIFHMNPYLVCSTSFNLHETKVTYPSLSITLKCVTAGFPSSARSPT